MSRIYFHTPEDTAEVRGNERAHFGVFCDNLAWSLIDYYAMGSSPKLLRLFPDSHYAHNGVSTESIRIAFQHAHGELRLGDKPISPFSVALNTTLKLGNDAVKFAARIHGQCEIHCWAKGENRAWLAGVVQQGLNCGFYREDMGWDGVIELLSATDTTPVVLSYSVCESFPNSTLAGCLPDDDAWYELSAAEQWRSAMTGLVTDHAGLELEPCNWDKYYFEDGYTAMDLAKDLAALAEVTQ